MRPSTKAELALNGLTMLADLKQTNPKSLSVLAKEQSISLSYLEQVFSSLKNKGLVKGVRGPGGGYVLAKDPSDINIAEVLLAIDDTTENPGSNSDKITKIDKINAFWKVMIGRTIELYSNVTLEQVINGSTFFIEDTTETTSQAAE
tara:strand:+ start:70 stop:510 length:441 start_codon:yes stop_codon:yes gene_type:complete